MTIASRKIGEELREMIFRGEIEPGEHLRESALAEQFQVSRTPVRAALASIAQDGLLDYEPNKGYLVRSIHEKDIRDAFEMRALLEGTVCRRVAEVGMGLEAELKARKALEQVDSITSHAVEVNEQLLGDWRDQNRIFHDAILNESQNRFIRNALDDVKNIPSVYPPVLAYYSLQDLQEFNNQHRLILECILSRRGSRVEHLMREHIYSALSLVSSILDKNR